jgi:YidC/Oxa1 family membrane protein insertase
MEDQGKRLLLAVVIAFGIMMAWSYLFPPETPPERDESSQTETGDGKPEQPTLPKPTLREGGTPQSGQPAAIGAPTATERGPEQRETFEFPNLRAVFTSYGGTLASWELLGDKYRVKEDGKTRQLDMVLTQGEAVLPFRIGFEGLELVPAESEWRSERKSDREIAFTWSYETEQNGQRVVLFDIVKTYRLQPEDYLLELTVSVANRNASDQTLAMILSLFGYQDPAADQGSRWLGRADMSWKSACLVNDELELAGAPDLSETPRQSAGWVRWGGFAHSYFLVAAAPNFDEKTQLGCRMSLVRGLAGGMQVDIVFPEFKVAVGDPPMMQTVTAYLGPKHLAALEKLPAKIGRDPGFQDAVHVPWYAVLARPMLTLLQLFHRLVSSWGLAIVMLTITVKLATLYWTTKSMRSMKQMAKLRPKVEALQKKYKDDRQKQQVEMMNLYKAHGVNPMAGCLPMLLQVPIWMSLYEMLRTAAELYHEPFIPGWIDDLTAADPYFIMPVVLIGMMFLQAKMSPATVDSVQQKVMMYGLPLMFGTFSLFLPSGLTLYILTNTVLTLLHQLYLNRTDPKLPLKGDLTATAKSGGAGKPSGGAGKAAGKAAAAAARDDQDSEPSETAKSEADASDAGDEDSDSRAASGAAPKRSGSKKRGAKSRRR